MERTEGRNAKLGILGENEVVFVTLLAFFVENCEIFFAPF
jgi:hypothetical protein